MQEAALAHVDAAAVIDVEGRDGVVRVVGIEAVEEILRDVGPIIAIRIFEQQQKRLLREIDTLRRELEADRHVEPVGKHGLLVGPAVAVGVFVDQQLVIRLGIARLVVGIARQRGDPQPAPVVEPHLAGVAQVGKLLLRGEERHRIAIGKRERRQGLFLLDDVVGAAIFGADREVCLHRREWPRLRVIDSK